MPNRTDNQPWKILEPLLAQGDAAAVDEFLDTLSPADVARTISRISEEGQATLLTLLEPEDAADLIEELSDAQGADLIEDLPAVHAAAIVDELDSDHRADLLGEMDKEDAEAILEKMLPEEAEEARELLEYPPDTAGGIMVKEFVVYDHTQTVGDVLDDLRTNAELYSDYGVQYAYVQSDTGTLIGVLRLRDLVLSQNPTPINEVMIVNPISVPVLTPLDELEQSFDRYMFSGLPVINDAGKLVGVAQRADAEEAHYEQSERDFMRFSGIVDGQELRSQPIVQRSLNRFWWLGANLFLSILAALVIVLYQDTIDKVIALAAIIPVLANVSGCSGNQAIAVTIREMALGLLHTGDVVRVISKELFVGLINGLALGILFAIFVMLWKGDAQLAFVVGLALSLNTLLAVCLGGAIPLILRKMNIDPALAAAPMLTTTVDMAGFFLILSLASSLLT